MNGRFYVAYRYGVQEINYDLLGDVLKELVLDKKYPLVMMPPPHSVERFVGNSVGWEDFHIILYFCKTTYYGDGNTLNPKTATSLHTVAEDWQDMKRCAKNFMRCLNELQRTTFPSLFRIPNHEAMYAPFSNVSLDRVSGVKIDFDLSIFTGCELEDYNSFPTNLNISIDGHPEHQL